MFAQDLRLQKPLEEFIECWERLSVRAVPLLQGMLTPEAVYQDPYHRAQGFEKIEALLLERLKFYPKIRVQDFSWGRRDGQAYIYWSAKGLDAISVVSFFPDGQIVSVVEHWGAHEIPRSYKKFTP